MGTCQLRPAKSATESNQNKCGVTKADKADGRQLEVPERVVDARHKAHSAAESMDKACIVYAFESSLH